MKIRRALAVAAVTLIACTVLACASASAAQAKGPGKVVITFMERAEAHSGAPVVSLLPSEQNQKNGEIYMYTMLSAFRKLDKGVTGNVYYMNKYSIDNGSTMSHIGGLDITDDLTGKWKLDIGYSHDTNPATNIVPSSNTDRFSFALDFKWNPNEKAKKRYAFRTTYSTGTDFSVGRTLSEKLTVSDNITKKLSYALAYQFVWGLSMVPAASGQCAVCREHFANQYYADFYYKLTKKDRLSLGYLFLKNLYNGSRGDDSIGRFSYYRTVR